MTVITSEALARDIAQFLAFQRALGHSYVRGAATLASFQRFVNQCAGPHEPLRLESVVGPWLEKDSVGGSARFQSPK